MAETTVLAPKTPQEAPETARDWIFMHESSNNPAAINSIGCKGLGQDCNGQLEIDCPSWQIDRECQTSFFDQYAIKRYGSWDNAKSFWLEHNWY